MIEELDPNEGIVVDAGPAEDMVIPPSEYSESLVPGGLKRVKQQANRSDAMYYVPVSQLVVMEGFNIRIRNARYLTHVRKLANSIKEHGYEPDSTMLVYVRDNNGADELVVIDGHSRLEAIGIAREEGVVVDQVPVIFAPKSMNIEDAMVKLRRRNGGSLDITPMEQAIWCKRAEAREFSQVDMARELGVSASYVGGLMLLASAPRALVNLVVTEVVTPTMAIKEIRKHGPEAAAKRLKAMADAQAEKSGAGKAKVTDKHRPEAKFESGVKRAAPKLFEQVRSITDDPGYLALSKENRDAISALVAELEGLKAP